MAVLNKHKDFIPEDAVNIMRGSEWGNPFIIGKHGSRSEVILKHQRKLWEDIRNGGVNLRNLADLHGKDLVCCCAPQRCHGHTLEAAASWAYELLRARGEI